MKKASIFLVLLIFFISSSPKPVTWVAIGDSITYLNDHPEETGNRITKGYLTGIGEEFPQLEVVNKGYNGWTAVRIAEEFEKLEIPKAEVYSVFLGTNDWWRGNTLGTFENYQQATGTGTVFGAFRTIVDKIHALNPEAKIILITPMKRVDFVYINNPKNNAYGSYRDKNGQSLESFAKAVSQIGQEEGFPVADLYHSKKMDHADLVKFKWVKNPKTGKYQKYKYPDFLDLAFDPEKDEYPYPVSSIGMTYDGLHPSDKGYREIVKLLKPIFQDVMNEIYFK